MVAIADKRPPAALRRWAISVTVAFLALLAPAIAEAAAPVVKATWSREVTATSFRATATIDTGQETTEYHFDYIPTAQYEANVAAGQPAFQGAARIPIGAEAKIFASTSDQEISQRIAGLSPDTAYRFRLVAKNGTGEVVGPERAVRTQENSTDFSLPDGRAWELVSPVDKNGGSIPRPDALFGGGDFQAAGQGGSITFDAAISFGEAAGAPNVSQYVATRSSSGWSTRNVSLPSEAGAFPDPEGVPFRLFAPDLSRALALALPHAFTLLAAPSYASAAQIASGDLRFAGATADLSHLGFTTCKKLTADATEAPGGGGGCDVALPNLYELSALGALRLVNLQPGQSQGTPGAELAAQSGAMSDDGSRIYWKDGDGSLLLRDGSRTLEIAAVGNFQVASADGAVAYYTSSGHLYRYSLSTESSSDLTPAAGVQGVLGASADGSYVYFLDGGGLELWHAGAVVPVAADASPSSSPPASGTARVSADGTKLLFLSDLPLTGYESLGALELFRYDAIQDSLLCASCNPTGARPLGPAGVPGARPNGEEVLMYKPRLMDAQGTRVFFDSEDAISAKDTNTERDVYEWRAQSVAGCTHAEGCIGLLSSGRGANGATFLDASSDGADVFFLTDESLVATDPGSTDVYDARIGGGFPEPPAPIPCFGDACQPLPPEPEDPTPGTAFIGSERNPTLSIETPGRKHKGHKHRKKHRKHRKHPSGGRKGGHR